MFMQHCVVNFNCKMSSSNKQNYFNELPFFFVLDNIDTKAVLEAIRECISACNVYLRDCNSSINHTLLLDIAKYITEILKVFGIKTADEIGFPVSEGSSSNDVSIIFNCYLLFVYISFTLRNLNSNQFLFPTN